MKLETALTQLREIIRRKHLSLATEESYAHWLARFSRFVRERCQADWKPEQKMEAFLTQLARQEVSASNVQRAIRRSGHAVIA